jgi:hypothetical protein
MEFPAAPALVPEAPAAHGLRSILLGSFPIKLVYAVRDNVLLVVAVFHARRRPGYWLGRLPAARASPRDDSFRGFLEA